MTTVTRRVACRPQAVLDVLADGWSYATWVVGTSAIRHVSDDWPRADARVDHSFGVWPLTIDDFTEVHAWRPGSGIDLLVRGWPAGEAHVRIDVRSAGPGCEVRIVEDAVSGPGLLVPRIVRQAILHARNSETLRRLALLAEGGANRSPVP